MGLFSRRKEPTLTATSPSTALVAYTSTPTSTPRSVPTSAPGSAAASAAPSTPASTSGSTALLPVDPATEDHYLSIYEEAGTVVDISRRPLGAPHPDAHALELLGRLLEQGFAGQPITEKALEKFYLTICWDDRVRPFPWRVVLLAFGRLMRQLCGSDHKKTYKRVYDRGRLRKRRVYRVPTVAELAQAADPETVVPLMRA